MLFGTLTGSGGVTTIGAGGGTSGLVGIGSTTTGFVSFIVVF